VLSAPGNHTAAFAAAAAGPDGDRFVHDAGLAMVLTIADVARSESVGARLIGRTHKAGRDRCAAPLRTLNDAPTRSGRERRPASARHVVSAVVIVRGVEAGPDVDQTPELFVVEPAEEELA
jgi:hypothetical protein